jgi:ribosome-binding factor A
MPSQRIERVQKLLRSEISEVILRRLKDPRVGMVTITDVRVTADLRHARVFVSVYQGAQELSDTVEGLRSGAGFIRAELMKVLHLRPMPMLEFHADDSLERGARTLDLLDKIRHEEEHNGSRSGAGGPPASEE